ncbi:polygalacturonase ADPG1-like [Phoenix dactylifera]|uniref:endo-polygalacturonase n=1 Tax=Phoenix dactylifera TaxID=42345 RepID=A0A8B9A9J0_PHODC|nr:polygalacturonase ADPG1-like [Phoenix dactylifera]
MKGLYHWIRFCLQFGYAGFHKTIENACSQRQNKKQKCASVSKGVANVFLVLVFASLAIGVLSGPTYNVTGYGAKGDGRTDDTQAFMAAWNAACTDSKAGTSVLVPAGKTFLLSAVSFKGPCKSSIHVQIDGTILAPNKTWILNKVHWINFMFIKGLTIAGSGVIDGQGAIWWHCIAQKQCATAPMAFNIGNCMHVQLSGLSFKNSPMMHVTVHDTVGANLTKLRISAPADSPNTDGVHIERSQEVQITHSTIGTGDDCISIGSGTYNLNVSWIDCGPGHGISIGSLGRNGSIAQVEQIHVSSCNFYQTTNGARIKTWQGGRGYAKGISFKNLTMFSARRPIIIDQYYCEHRNNCANKTSAVQVSNVQFDGVAGSSADNEAIVLRCSESTACTGITLANVNITSADPARPATAFCLNAHGKTRGTVIPAVPCLDGR